MFQCGGRAGHRWWSEPPSRAPYPGGVREGGGIGDWFRAGTSLRLLGILLLLAAGAALCIRLGAWQLDRAYQRADEATAAEQQALANAEPEPLSDVVAPQRSFTQGMVGTHVQLSGRYLPDKQFFVGGRQLGNETGYWLLSAFEVDVAGAGAPETAILPVVRGWVSQPDPRYLDVPTGEVDLTGYLAAPESADMGLMPDIATGAHVQVVSPAQLVNIWGAPMYSGQMWVDDQQPAGAYGAMPAPQRLGPPVTEDAGLNIRNLAYAAEWWIFGGFALVLWWRMVRDEVHHIRRQREPAAT